MQTSKAGILNSPCSGYTLFELIIVCLLIGIIASVVVPSISRPSPEQAIGTAERRIAGAVSEARARALLKQEFLELHIERHHLSLRQRNGGVLLNRALLPEGTTVSRVLVDQKLQRTLLFSPKGITQSAQIEISSPPCVQRVYINPVQGVAFQN